MKTSTLALATLLTSATLFAAPIDTSLLDEEFQIQLEELLQRKVDIESQSHLARISILETAEICIQNVDTIQEYRTCEREESQARQELREELKDDKQQLREDFKALIAEIRASKSE